MVKIIIKNLLTLTNNIGLGMIATGGGAILTADVVTMWATVMVALGTFFVVFDFFAFLMLDIIDAKKADKGAAKAKGVTKGKKKRK